MPVSHPKLTMQTNKRRLPILIDTSLTGGRGPAKKTYEFAQRCKELGVAYRLLTNSTFAFKLADMGLKVDYTIDVSLSDPATKILRAYRETMANLAYGCLVRFGARNPGSTQARVSNKPYVIVDGGLPDKMEPEPSLYDIETFQQAQSYIVTTQFPWQPPFQLNLDNVQTGFFTLSAKTIQFIRQLRDKSKPEVINELSQKQKSFEVLKKPNTLFINFLMTSNYVADPLDRTTYGAWLKTDEYDACVGFVRRLVTDLGIQRSAPTVIFMDEGVVPVVQDLTATYPQISTLTFEPDWDYRTEIMVTQAADLNLSRATNYQPFVALLGNGGSITSPVPANGYMDEDTAAYQYQALGMTEVIEYNDEFYVQKLLRFVKDQARQRTITSQQLKIAGQFLAENNSADLVLKTLGLT